MENKASTRVAFCGLFAAFMLVVMLLGTAIPMSTFLAPALAGALVYALLNVLLRTREMGVLVVGLLERFFPS